MGSAFCCCVACVSHVHDGIGRDSHAYLEELVGRLLVFLGHGGGLRLGKGADDAEDGEAGTEAHDDAPGDAGVGAGRVDSAGAMGTEGDPVCW